MDIIVENIDSHISSVLIAMFYTQPEILNTNIDYVNMYLQEYIKINFINKIKSGKSIMVNDLTLLKNIISHYGCTENTIPNLYSFLIAKVSKANDNAIQLVNNKIPFIAFDLDENTNIKILLQLWLSKNIITNVPNMICISINRKNDALININKKISANINNDILQRNVWSFHAAICINHDHSYVLFYDKNYYIFDDLVIPSIIQVNIKDKYIMDKIISEVVFVIYVG